MTHRLEQERDKFPLIYMIYKGVYGVVVEQDAFISRVHYNSGGFFHDIYVENDEFLVLENTVSEESNELQLL